MKKKYLYNGQILDQAAVEDGARASKLDVDTYIQKAGMQTVDDSYMYQGKSLSAEDVLDGANASKLGFDDYIQKAGFQKKNGTPAPEPTVSVSGSGAANGTPTSAPSTSPLPSADAWSSYGAFPANKSNAAAPPAPEATATPVVPGQPSRFLTQPSDVFDLNKNLPPDARLDALEKKQFTDMGAARAPEAIQRGIADDIIARRNNPIVKYNNAKTFLSQDIDTTYQQAQNSKIQRQNGIVTNASIPAIFDFTALNIADPEEIKRNVTDETQPIVGDKIPSIEYANQRREQIDAQIQDLKKQQYTAPQSVRTQGNRFPTYQTLPSQNYEALQKKIDELSQYKETLLNYTDPIAKLQVYKTVNAAPEKSVNPYMEMGLKYVALQDPIAVENKNKNIQTGADNVRDKILVQSENYQYETEGLSMAADAAKILYASGKMDKATYETQLNEVKQKLATVDVKYPEVRLQRIKGALGQIIDSNRAGQDGTWQTSVWDNMISAAPSEGEINAAVKELNDKGANITVQEASDFIHKSADIGNTALLGRTFGGMANLANKIADVTRLQDENTTEAVKAVIERDYANTPDKAIFQPENIISTEGTSETNTGFLQTAENPKAGLHNWGWGTINMVADGVGTLGKLALLTELTGGLANAAFGAEIGVGVAEGSVGTEIIGGKLVQRAVLSAAQKQYIGTVAGMYIDTYTDAHEAAKHFIGDEQGGEAARQAYGNTMGLLNGIAWTILPADKVLHDIIDKSVSAGAGKFAELIPKEGLQGLTENTFKKFVVNALTETAKAQGKMEAISAITQVAQYTAQAMFNPQSVQQRNLGQEVVDGAIEGLSFLPITLLEGRGLAKNIDKVNTLTKEAIFRVADDPSAFKDFTNKQVAEGKISQSDANAKIQLVNTAVQIKKEIPSDLTKPEKIEYGANLLFIRKLNAEKETIKDPSQIERIDKKLAELKKANDKILDTSTGIIEQDAVSKKTAHAAAVRLQEKMNPKPAEPVAETPGQPAQETAALPADKLTEAELSKLSEEDQVTYEDAAAKDDTKAIAAIVARVREPESVLNKPADQVSLADIQAEIQRHTAGQQKPTVESAIIKINGNTYEGKNHAEAIASAAQAGEDISKIDRTKDGKFKLSDGSIIDRATAKADFGHDRSEQLIPQDEAAKKADAEYAAAKPEENIPGQPENITQPIELNITAKPENANISIEKEQQIAALNDKIDHPQTGLNVRIEQAESDGNTKRAEGLKQQRTDIHNQIKELSKPITRRDISKANLSNGVLKEGKEKVAEYIDKARAVLAALYPKAKLRVFNTTKEYEAALGPQGTSGVAHLAKNGNHRILLDLEAIKRDKSGRTVFHEVIHPIIADAFGVHPEQLNPIFDKLIAEMKGVPGMEAVFEHMKLYEDNAKADEGLTEFITQLAMGNIDIKDIPKQRQTRIIDLINKILEHLGFDFRIDNPQDFLKVAVKIKKAFETSSGKGLKDVIKEGNIDKFVAKYIERKDISSDKLKKLHELLHDKIKAEFEAGKISKEDAGDIYKKLNLETPRHIEELISKAEKNNINLPDKTSQDEQQLREQLPDTLSPAEKQGAISGGEENAAATIITGAIFRASEDSKGGGKRLSTKNIKALEETHLKSHAEQSGTWIEKSFGKPHANGAEQDVYRNPDGKTVTKVNSNVDPDTTWNDFFHRIAIHNSLFPDVAYTLKGFTEQDGNFSAVLEQPLVEGRNAKFEEVKTEMERNGFKSIDKNSDDAETKFTFENINTGVIVKDLHGENVLKSESGKLYFIDPIIELTEDRKKHPEKYKDATTPEPLSNTEQKQFDGIPMAEKLALARKNLPIPDNMSNVDVAREAHKNAKALLDKLPGRKKAEPVQNANISIPEPIDEAAKAATDKEVSAKMHQAFEKVHEELTQNWSDGKIPYEDLIKHKDAGKLSKMQIALSKRISELKNLVKCP